MRDVVSRSETAGGEPRYFIHSLARGLAVLTALGAAQGPLSVTELARRLGWTKATTHRFLFTLQALGYVDQDGDTRRYRLGIRVLELGFAYFNGLGFPRIAQPYLERLAAELKEGANLGVLDGREVVYVARGAPSRLMDVSLHVGSRLPAHCTSLGKALLAYRPWDEVAALYRDQPPAVYTPKTLASLDALRAALADIRMRGYAVADQEIEEGVRAVAAPVRSSSGAVIAAVNIGTPAGRVGLEELQARFAPIVVRAAEEISAALGYRAPSVRAPGTARGAEAPGLAAAASAPGGASRAPANQPTAHPLTGEEGPC